MIGIEQLRKEFSSIQRIDPSEDAYKRLCAILDKADNKTLKIIHEAKINFVSALALNRLIRRGQA